MCDDRLRYSVKWRHNGEEITSESSGYTLSGHESPPYHLTVVKLSMRHAGTYDCVVDSQYNVIEAVDQLKLHIQDGKHLYT